ncbi:MAG: carbon starvation protein A [Myxococcaceae bacterium]|nr:carbon starvation protein A [Myxococcaceae bacterium]
MLSLPLIALAVMVLLALGYRFYGGFISRQYALDDNAATPAHRHEDGVDFVPTRPFSLLGQHFSAIAAAGPIAGPILAAKQFGWLPALLWIALGVVFIGAVHDFSALVASVRHGGKSIAEVVKANLGPKAGVSMLAFIWVALIYVIVAFTDVTASTFVAKDPDLAGIAFDFNQGGAVAAASTLYLALAIVLGLVDRYLKPPLWLSTVIFVPLTLAAVWAGTLLSTVLQATPLVWGMVILAYCFVASLSPMWLLLQPRGYLGGFVLYLALAIGTLGIFFGGFEVKQEAFKGFSTPGNSGLLFPFLFVTIACGACSGFHGLVCSGTTSKQIDKESHCHPVGFGAMLLEGFVAVIALATVMIAAPSELAGKGPGTLYSIGLGRFFSVLIGEQHLPFAITFGAMAFSTFVFDTLDVSTRLGRYILQELFGWKSRLSSVGATLLTVAVPAVFIWVAKAGAWQSFWMLFGTSNQLLAALSLLGISVWLKKLGKRYWYTFVPMIFVSAITVTSLVLHIRDGFFGPEVTALGWVNAGVAVVLLALASSLWVTGVRVLMQPVVTAVAAEPVAG